MTLVRHVPNQDHWSLSNLPELIPDQTGRRALITGANSGIGYFAALELARAGAHVVLGVRDRVKGESALARLKAELPSAHAELGLFDLASLQAVREFAAHELDRGIALDILIDNAGVMAPPRRLETADGFELQFGTNVLGHYALTGLLFPLLELAATKSTGFLAQTPHIVIVASIAHKRGTINFDDLQSHSSYSPMKAYQQSKLADLMLAFELDRRLRARMSPILSVAAHPGVANTNLFQVGDFSLFERTIRRAAGHAIGALLNSDAEGSLPTIYAAVAPEAKGGGYYGPQGFQEMRGGDVGEAKVSSAARDATVAGRIWETCAKLTNVGFL